MQPICEEYEHPDERLSLKCQPCTDGSGVDVHLKVLADSTDTEGAKNETLFTDTAVPKSDASGNFSTDDTVALHNTATNTDDSNLDRVGSSSSISGQGSISADIWEEKHGCAVKDDTYTSRKVL